MILRLSENDLLISENKNQHWLWHSIAERLPACPIFIGEKDSFYEISEGKCE
jgi:hypothetical protein